MTTKIDRIDKSELLFTKTRFNGNDLNKIICGCGGMVDTLA